jgi:hypothetical protein
MTMPHASEAAAAAPAEIPPGQVEYGGQRCMKYADGSFMPLDLVKPADKLRDEFVRENLARAEALSVALAAFKAWSLEGADVLLDILASSYKVVLGGKKGNVLFESLDGTLLVQVAVAERITFGAELQVAKAAIDQLVAEWGERSPPEMLALVQSAFRANKDGELSPGKLLGLKRIDIPDDRWRAAMQAITDSMRVVGSRRYVRFKRRASPDDAWSAVPMALSDV